MEITLSSGNSNEEMHETVKNTHYPTLHYFFLLYVVQKRENCVYMCIYTYTHTNKYSNILFTYIVNSKCQDIVNSSTEPMIL